MKNKILLNGATRSSNFGDFLFAYIFQSEVIKSVGANNTFWYKSPFALSNFFKKNLNYNSNYKLRNVDALVNISGGYFCGNDRTLKDYLFRYFSYFHICLRCVLKRIPYVFIGIDVSKPKSKLMFFIESFILKRASMVVVRNEESYKQVLEYGVKDPILTVDTAHAIKNYINQKDKQEYVHKTGKMLFLHVSYPYYTRMILPAINGFLANHNDYSVIIGTDQYRSDYSFLDEIRNSIKAKCVIYKYENPLDLCILLNTVDFIITPKLHVGIVGATFGKSVVAIPYHEEKILRFYKQIDQLNRVMPVSGYKEEDCIALLEKFHNIPICLDVSFEKTAKKNIALLHDFINS